MSFIAKLLTIYTLFTLTVNKWLVICIGIIVAGIKAFIGRNIFKKLGNVFSTRKLFGCCSYKAVDFNHLYLFQRLPSIKTNKYIDGCILNIMLLSDWSIETIFH